jgi:hypothetical protein
MHWETSSLRGQERLRLEQLTWESCAFCVLISQLAELSEFDKLVYQEHLRHEHNIPKYEIER